MPKLDGRQTSQPPWYRSPEQVTATCRHEAAHALRAHAYGFPVRRLFLDHEGGMAVIELPVSPAELPAAYRRDPARTAQHLQGIMETILAGAAINGQPMNFGDTAELGTWRLAWPLDAHPAWPTLHRRAETAVALWVREPATRTAVALLARHLAQAPGSSLTGATLQGALATATGQPLARRTVRPPAAQSPAAPAAARPATPLPPRRKPPAPLPAPAPRPTPPPALQDLAATLALVLREGLGGTGRWGRASVPGDIYGGIYA